MSIIHPPPGTILASARLHVDTAIALVGRDQVLAWISASPNPLTLTATPDISVASSTTTIVRKTASCDTVKSVTTGTRGRKSGIIPPAEQRCSWTLTSGEQCANKKKGDNALCGLHIGKVHLVDTGAKTTSVVKKSDNHIALIYDSASDESDDDDASDHDDDDDV